MAAYAHSTVAVTVADFDACADSVYQALFPRKKGSLGSKLGRGLLQNLQPARRFLGRENRREHTKSD